MRLPGCVLTCFALTLLTVSASAAGQEATLPRPPGLERYEAEASDSVEITIDDSVLRLASKALGPEWRPLVRVRSGRGAEQTHVYVRDAGDDLKLMIVAVDGDQATVIRAKVSPEALAKFARDPKILGISLR